MWSREWCTGVDSTNNVKNHGQYAVVFYIYFECGSGGIRTLDTRKRMTVFKTVAFNHSATLPVSIVSYAPEM